MTSPYTVWAFWIVLNEKQQVLLVLRNDIPFRNLPWGQLEDKESPRDAVIREVKEETGLQVKIDRLVGVYAKNDKNDVVFLFTCSVISWELTLNAEAKDFCWSDFDTLPSNLKQTHRVRLQDFFYASNDQLIMRVQDSSLTK